MLDLKKYLTKVAERLNWLIQGTQYSTDAVVIDNQTVGAVIRRFLHALSISRKEVAAC